MKLELPVSISSFRLRLPLMLVLVLLVGMIGIAPAAAPKHTGNHP